MVSSSSSLQVLFAVVSGIVGVIAQTCPPVSSNQDAAMCDLWQGFDPFVFGNCNENYAPNVCKWTGVSCDNCGTVTGFDLVDMSGTISPSLGELTALTSFVIKASPPLLGSSSPEVHGTLPPEIGSLSNLIKLDLGESSISGTIPMELSQLTSLTYLNLGTCKLGGPIPDIFYNLKNLSELYLDHNSFTGNVPPSVCALTELNTFYLDNNQLSCCPTCLLNAPNPGDTLPVADPNALIPGGGGATYGSKTGSLTNLAGKRLDPESSSSTCKVFSQSSSLSPSSQSSSLSPSSQTSSRITSSEMTNLIFLLMAVISGPSILALFCECFGVFKSWRAAIHDKAFDSFRSLYDGDGNYEWIDKELELGTSYTKYKGMGSSYTYSGLPAFLYPDGITLRGIRIFEKGAFEDFLCYVMNEEEFLSIFLADDRNPFTRLMRRSHFPAVHGIMLFLYSYAAVAMAEGDSSSYYSITYFLIVPGQWILSLILKRALAWNCCYSCRGGCCSKYVWHYLVRAPVFYMAVLQIGSIAIYTQTFASAGLSYQVALYYVFNYFCIVMIVSTLLSLCRIFVCFSADPFIDKLGACCGAIRHAFPWTWATMHNQVVETEKASGRAVTNEKVEELA